MTHHTRAARLAAGIFVAGSMAGTAQAAEIDELKSQLEQLAQRIAHIEAERKAAPAAAPAAQAAPAAVTAGDFPGSYKLPGTDTSVKIGGFINLSFNHDLDGYMDPNNYEYFAVPAIPLKGSPRAERKGRSFFDARYSRLNFETRTPTRYGPLRTFIETDFYQYRSQGGEYQINDSTNRLRQAYAEFGNFLLGQTWTTFIDLASLADTLDFGGPSGATTVRQPLIRYTMPVGEGSTLALAVENSKTDFLNASGHNAVSLDERPDFVAKFKTVQPWGQFYLSGVQRQLRLHDDTTDKDITRNGWGYSLGGILNVGSGGDYLHGQINGGRGIGRYMADLFNFSDAGTYDGDRLKLSEARGFLVGYAHYWTPSVRSNFAYGRLDLEDHPANSYDGVADERYQTVHANLLWSPIPQADVGIEWITGERKAETGEKGRANRLMLGARFRF